MAELDDFPEKVRNALILLPCMASSAAEDMAVDAVQAELLRLAARVQELERENAELHAEVNLVTHKVITCGVAARHPDANLSRTGAYAKEWNSQQADDVRALRDSKERAESELAALKARIAASRRVSVGMYPTHGSGHIEVICDYDQCPDKEARPYALLDMGKEG